MKPTLLTLSFLLFAFTTKLPLAFSLAQVGDLNDEPVFADNELYILAATYPQTGGGVKLGKTGDSTCPTTVLQDYLNVNDTGLIVRFRIDGYSLGPGDIFAGIRGTRLDIEFSNKSNCAKSSKWMVFVDNDIQKSCIGIGGPEDYPGKQTITTGHFHIEEYKTNYKLVFCVSLAQNCLDIGMYDNKENGTRLYLTENDPFEVKFLLLRRPTEIRSTV